jgi:hypothetical protein
VKRAHPIEEEARRLRVASRKAQGLKRKVSDPVTIGKVAAMLKSETGRSDLPLGRDPRRVEAIKATASGVDRDVVEDGREDGPPATERQTAP